MHQVIGTLPYPIELIGSWPSVLGYRLKTLLPPIDILIQGDGRWLVVADWSDTTATDGFDDAPQAL